MKTEKIDVHGHTFNIRSDRFGDLDVVNEIVGEDFYRLREMKSSGFSPSRIVDIGGHIGTFAAFAHSLWPEAEIFCIEPNPDSYELLRKNAPSAHAMRAAIRYDAANILTDADNATGAGFMTTPEAFGDSAKLKHRQDGYLYEMRHESVPLLTFEELCDHFEIGTIDLLKLDCEGSEVHLFENMDRSRGNRIEHVLGEYHMPGGFGPFKTLAEEALPHLEFYGGNASDIGPFWSRPRRTQTFKHSGDIGDIIYSLPTIRALGGGILSLSPAPFTRQRMNEAIIDSLKPLFQLQPYLSGFQLASDDTVPDHDLDRFRLSFESHGHLGNSLANYHLATFDINEDEANYPWLTVDYVGRFEGLPVVVSRSPRCRNPRFPWGKVVDKYRGKILFVGLQDEHEDFCSNFGPVPYYPTKDFLELARVIAGSELFIGNQSAPYAVAEGLKVRTIQEVDPKDPNCLYPRPNAMYVWNETVDLPDV